MKGRLFKENSTSILMDVGGGGGEGCKEAPPIYCQVLQWYFLQYTARGKGTSSLLASLAKELLLILRGPAAKEFTPSLWGPAKEMPRM